MDKYYKVVRKLSDGRLVSCCAGNKEEYNLYYPITHLPPQEYKLNQFVSNYESPLMVFSEYSHAIKFIDKTFWHGTYCVYRVEIVKSNKNVIHIVSGQEFPCDTVFAYEVKLVEMINQYVSY